MNNTLNFSWRSVLLVTLGITAIIIIFTFVPILARKEHTIKEKQIDILLHRGNSPDYSVYLATITMGQTGKPYFRNYFSPTETKPLPIHSFYWITGLLTGPFHLWPPYAYHLARIFTVLSFGVVLYFLTRSVFRFPWQGMTAAIISLLVPIMPAMFFHQEIAKSFQPWWNLFLSPINRLDPPPHHLAAQVFLLLAIASYLFYRKKHQRRFAVGSAVAIVLSIFMVPQTALPFLFVVSADALFIWFPFLLKKSTQVKLESVVPIILIAVAILSIKILSFSIGGTRWIPNQIWEIGYWGRDPYFYYHLYVSFLPLVLFAIPAVIAGIIKRDTTRMLLFVWAMTPLLVAPFTQMLGMGTGRLLQDIIHIPLTILSVLTITDAMTRKFFPKYLPLFIIGLLIFYSAIQLPQYAKMVWDSYKNQEYNWWYYLPKSVYEAVEWITKNIPVDTKLISIEGVGNPIVSFAPVIVYQGDQTHGYNWDLDLSKLYLFYMRNMSDTQALSWLKSLGISYVVDDMRRPAQSFYPFLATVWENSALRIYKVDK